MNELPDFVPNYRLIQINRELGKSSIADHVTTTRHNVNFEHASVICLQPNTTKRKISEALLIKAHTVVKSNTPSISLAIFWNVTIFSCFHFIFTAPDDGRWLRPKYSAFVTQLKADHFKKLDLEIWMKLLTTPLPHNYLVLNIRIRIGTNMQIIQI